MPAPTQSDIDLFRAPNKVLTFQWGSRNVGNGAVTDHFWANKPWNEPRPGAVRQWRSGLGKIPAIRRALDPNTRAGVISSTEVLQIPIVSTEVDFWIATLTDQTVDQVPCTIRIGRTADPIENHFVLFEGYCVRVVRATRGQSVIEIRDRRFKLNAAIASGVLVGGTGPRATEPLPLIIGGAQSVPLISFDTSDLLYKFAGTVSGSFVSSQNPQHLFGLVRANGLPQYQAIGPIAASINGGDPALYDTASAHGLALHDVVEILSGSVYSRAFVVAVPSPTQLRLAFARATGPETGWVSGAGSQLVAKYGYSVRANGIVQFSAPYGGGELLTIDCLLQHSLSLIGGGTAVVFGLPAKQIGDVFLFASQAIGLVANADVDAASIAAANLEFNTPAYDGYVGRYEPSRGNRLALLAQLLSYARAYVGFSRLGKAIIGVLPRTYSPALFVGTPIIGQAERFAPLVFEPTSNFFATHTFCADVNAAQISAPNAQLSPSAQEVLRAECRMSARTINPLGQYYPSATDAAPERVALIRQTYAGLEKWAENAGYHGARNRVFSSIKVLPHFATLDVGEKVRIKTKTSGGDLLYNATVIGVVAEPIGGDVATTIEVAF